MEVQAQGRGTVFLGTNDVYTSFMVAPISLGMGAQRTDKTMEQLVVYRTEEGAHNSFTARPPVIVARSQSGKHDLARIGGKRAARL